MALTFMAGDVGEIPRYLLAPPFAVGLAPAPLEIAQHALERLLGFVGAQAVVVEEPDRRVAGAVEDRVAGLGGQILPGRVERDAVMLAERFERLRVIGARRARPRCDRALAQ